MSTNKEGTMAEKTEGRRFVVRECDWDWLPDWLVIDTVKQIRAAAYDDEESARAHCAEMNGAPDAR